MKKKQEQTSSEYRWPHPRFKTSTDKKWLEGRNKYPTGFCSSYIPLDAQGHEGTKPVNRMGNPIKICPFPDTCPCTCHQEVDNMYAMAGLPRPELEQTHEYLESLRSQTHSEFVQDVVETVESSALSNAGGTDTHRDNEGTYAGQQGSVRGTLGAAQRGTRAFNPTPTGRRARGQLEYDVLTVCQEFARDIYEWIDCTPKLVAERIGIMNATEPPSTGAINAVWDRWEKLGFAEQAKKPSRFVKFSGSGTAQELDALKLQVKRDARRTRAEARRGSLRPKR